MTKSETPKVSAHSPSAPTQDSWERIGLGETVLYQENKGDGWWECTVMAIKDSTLTLKWRDYKLYKPFDVKRTKVGLLRKGD